VYMSCSIHTFFKLVSSLWIRIPKLVDVDEEHKPCHAKPATITRDELPEFVKSEGGNRKGEIGRGKSEN